MSSSSSCHPVFARIPHAVFIMHKTIYKATAVLPSRWTHTNQARLFRTAKNDTNIPMPNNYISKYESIHISRMKPDNYTEMVQAVTNMTGTVCWKHFKCVGYLNPPAEQIVMQESFCDCSSKDTNLSLHKKRIQQPRNN